MTINDMLEQGIVLHGYIEVVQYTTEPEPAIRANSFDERVLFRNILNKALYSRIDEPWAELQIKHMYSPLGCNGLTIEVEQEE